MTHEFPQSHKTIIGREYLRCIPRVSQPAEKVLSMELCGWARRLPGRASAIGTGHTQPVLSPQTTGRGPQESFLEEA